MAKANTKSRKLLALFLSVAMTLALLPLTGISAYAAGVPVEITTDTLPDGVKGVPYSKQLSATGDTPIIWQLSVLQSISTWPHGLTLSEDGLISGTPTEYGVFYFYITANNGYGAHTQGYSLNIHERRDISLSVSGTHTFPAQAVGYAAQAAKIATVTNTGERETGNLNVSLSGANAGAFKVTGGSAPVGSAPSTTILIDSIAVGGNDTFAVAPVTGLSAGTYTATVTASGDGFAKSFNVSFTVKSPPSQAEQTTKPVLVPPPAKTTNYTIKFNVNGGKALKKSLRTKTVKKGKTIGKLPTAARKNYKFKGWYTKKNSGKKVTSSLKVTKNATLYARWQKMERYGKVVRTAKLYVRVRPSMHAHEQPRVGTLKRGQTFKIKGFIDNKGTGNDWYKMMYKGKTRYVFAKYVKVVYK